MSRNKQPEPQPGGSHGQLERRPLEDRNLWWLGLVVVAFGSAARSGRSRSIRTPRGRASRAGWTRSSTPASSSPPAKAS